MARSTRPGPPSSRLMGLIEGDLPGHQRDVGEDGKILFVPTVDGPVFSVVSRIEKRFLGRTEIAVFGADLAISFPEVGAVAMRHTGRLQRTGVTAVLVAGGEVTKLLTSALATDRHVAEALHPLDFTSFDVLLGPEGSRVELELMGASHVAIALPPMRSYVHLHPDQREAMIAGVEAVRRAVIAAV